MGRRVLIGAFPDGGYGIRVSEPGYDVCSNPVDNERLHFNSDWPEVLPIYQRGYIYVPANQLTTVYFPYLGYIPYVSVLVQRPGRSWESYVPADVLMPIVRSGTSGSGSFTNSQLDAYCTDGNAYNNIRFYTFSNQMAIYSNNEAIYVYYFIYRVWALWA